MFERPEIIEMIRMDSRKIQDRARKTGQFPYVPDPETGKDLFTVHSGNKWLELEGKRPMPKMLFGEFWHQDELCILFADTNAGKSVLAVQIGNSLSRAEPIPPFAVEAEPANVLYIDFELTGKQFQLRYVDACGKFDIRDFGKSFYRAEFNANGHLPLEYKSFDDYINTAVEHYIKKTKAQVLIIDNITCLRNGTERTGEALPLMKHLKALKTKYNLSILVLAHTPKRNASRPLSVNDLQGSKMLINFADSAFAIGSNVNDAGQKYLKQIKQRNTTRRYGEDNVCLCSLQKRDGFLQFEFEGYGHERQQLRPATVANREELAQQAFDLSAQGRTQREISAELNVSLGVVNKLLRGK